MSQGKIFHAPERVVERGRGCWNCKHFDNQETARSHYQKRVTEERMGLAMHLLPSMGRLGDDDGSLHQVAAEAGKLIRSGHSMENAMDIALAKAAPKNPHIKTIVAEAKAQDARFHKFNQLMSRGAIGVCMIGKSPGDFVDCRYLCNDGWSGVQGSSLATSGQPLDKSADEMREEVNAKAKKV